MKTGILLSAIFALCMAVWSNDVMGQQPATGTLVPGHEPASPVNSLGGLPTRVTMYENVVVPDIEARQQFSRFAECVVDRDQPGVRAFVLSANLVDGPTFARWPGGQRVMRRCLSRLGSYRLSGNNQLFLGAFAQQLYISENRTLPAMRDAIIVPPEVAGETSPELVPWRFAECILLFSPSSVDYLLRVPPGSDLENNAFDMISASYQACIPADTQLRITRFNLRMIFGYLLFRHSVAAQADVGVNE